MKRDNQREAWTSFVESGGTLTSEPTKSKYGNRRVLFNDKWYASQREANRAKFLQSLAGRGIIKDYEEQKRITLVPGDGKLRGIVYIADFYYVDPLGNPHIEDAKGFKTQTYRLKKRLAALLLHITIEEI